MRLCQICLRNSENCKIVDASTYKSVFSQLTGVNVHPELWLCTWCVTILRRTVHLQRMAVKSQEILNNYAKHRGRLKSKAHPYKLTYHINQHIDISPNIDNNGYEDFPDAEIKRNVDKVNEIERVDILEGIDRSNIKFNIEDRDYLEPVILQDNILKKKKSNEFYKSMGFDVEYLTMIEQKDEIDQMKLCAKYMDMKYKCIDCGIGFMVEEDHEEHALRHQPEHGPHTCGICKRRYKSREVLWQHTLAHSRRFTCVNCSRRMKRADRHKCGSFRSEYSLIQNKEIENKKRNYICHHCNKKFASKQRLTIHLRTHTGSKPYPCTICSRTFSTNSNLRYHAAVHSDHKPHYCVECNTYYKTEKNLKRHFAESTRHVTSENMSYTCSECPKKFSSDKHLQNHIIVRHKTKYKCHHCDKNFYSNANLKKHIRCIHPEMKKTQE